MTYEEYINKNIRKIPVGTPILMSTMAKALAVQFSLTEKKATLATAVAMKGILDKNETDLRRFKKGIYFRTKKTPFGEVGIDREQLIENKYLASENGYETDLMALYRLGLTTQLPKKRVIATNKATECIREDKVLGVFIRPAKTKITKDNKLALQFLDVLALLKKAPVSVKNPYGILGKYLRERKLDFQKLLALAFEFYNQSVVIQLARIAQINEASRVSFYTPSTIEVLSRRYREIKEGTQVIRAALIKD